MTKRFVAIAVAALALATTTRAAEEAAKENDGGAGASFTKENFPYAALNRQPLTAVKGMVKVTVPVTVSLSKDVAFEGLYWMPVSIYAGLTENLQLGIVHGEEGGAGMRGGVCVGGLCDKRYDNVGVELAYSLISAGPLQFVVDAGGYASVFDDMNLSARVGAAFKMTLGNLAVAAKGSVIEAVNKRDTALVKGSWALEAEGQLQLGEGLAAFATLGAKDAFDTNASFNPDMTIPVGVGIEWEPIHKVDLGAKFEVVNAFGQNATFDEREAQVFVRLFL